MGEHRVELVLEDRMMTVAPANTASATTDAEVDGGPSLGERLYAAIEPADKYLDKPAAWNFCALFL